ncbi:MAG TPA: ion channel [Thermoanaerobaculia bacterium]|nr:ion channel [Thermoanaerobaculia bacterium]
MNPEVVHSPAVEHHARKPDVHLEIFIWGFAAAVLAAFLVTGFHYAKGSRELEWLYVTSILGLPLLQVPVVILMLRRNSDFWAKGALLLLPALAWQVLLWLAFTFRDICKGVLGLAAVTGLGFALFLGAVVFWVTSLIMGMADGKGTKFRTLLRDQPFLVVCFFLTIFTFITVFLSFSLALHDQDLRLNHAKLALYAEDIGPTKANDGDHPYDKQRQAEENYHTGGEEQGTESFKILFAPGSAAVEVEEGSPDTFNANNDVTPIENRRADNAINLDALADEIIKQSERGHVRVVLAGYSDDLPVSGSYGSNFELSLARISQVMVYLISRLERKDTQRKWSRSIEWLTLPSASEQGHFDGRKRSREERLAVEALLLRSDGDHGKDLSLLDYIYFGVYTITTTGYGDIIPISAYAKFITTIANFFEVFLMVVFFNVLLSFLREERDPMKAAAAEEEKAAA